MPQLLIHRGLAKKQLLENNINSFKYCFNKNYGIETDIHATKDSKFICFHDFTLKRIFKKNLSVKNLNYSKIKEISSNQKNTVPLFLVNPLKPFFINSTPVLFLSDEPLPRKKLPSISNLALYIDPKELAVVLV